jgi:hypothetical protein
MDEAELKKSNMATLRLNAKQYEDHEALMKQNMSEWPESLKRYLREYVDPASGGAIADGIAEWLRIRGG